MRFKTDWASLIVGSKFIVFALFYFVFEGNFPSTSPRGGLYLEGRFNERFFALQAWGAYIWRGLFRTFTVSIHIHSFSLAVIHPLSTLSYLS